jgi:hypothetical protein
MSWYNAEIPEHMLLKYLHQIETFQDPPLESDEWRTYLRNTHE